LRRLTTLFVMLFMAGCGHEPTGTSGAALLETHLCEVAGTGTLEEGDFVAGSARGTPAGITGRWMHDGANVVIGDATNIFCSINGVTLGDVWGPATYNGESGYRFRVHVQDFDNDHAREAYLETLTATRFYRPTEWEDGVLEIDDYATVTIPDELPVVVGNAANQWATLTFDRLDRGDTVTCRYRGGSCGYPGTPEEIEAGASYVFERCTGDDHGEVVAGDAVDVTSMTLRVQSGAHELPTREDAQTTVAVELEVHRPDELPQPTDFYRIVVQDAAGQRVLTREGHLAEGDLSIRPL
jgi:hypothetical protein